MRFLTLEECKRHLVVDHNDDDAMITAMATTAEDAIENELNRNLSNDYEVLSSPIKSAMLLYLGSLYNNREGFSTLASAPTAQMKSLIQYYKNYGNQRR
jgi:uncharacterized phage protein (predicted DNA packaging)